MKTVFSNLPNRVFFLYFGILCVSIIVALKIVGLEWIAIHCNQPTQGLNNTPKVRTEELAARFYENLKANGTPGVEIAISKDGQLAYSRTFGYADLESHLPAKPRTRFRIGSISKCLTATAIIQLAECGKLNLDAPIQTYIPTFPKKGNTITARMLAGHLGGVRHYQGTERLSRHHYSSLMDGLNIFKDDPLVLQPGEGFYYSSYGYNLLGAVVEKVSGERFSDYVHRHICDPLHLSSIEADYPNVQIQDCSRGYIYNAGLLPKRAPEVDNGYKLPSGGFLSCAEDLARFGAALDHPGFLKIDSLKQLFTPQRTKDGRCTGYGLGWNIGKLDGGRTIFWHAGDAIGGTSIIVIYPQSHIVVVVLTNMSGPPLAINDVDKIVSGLVN